MPSRNSSTLRHCIMLLVTTAAYLVTIEAVTSSQFYPFGESVGDEQLPVGNDMSQEISLQKPLKYFDISYNRIIINTNGFISFGERRPFDDKFSQTQLPLDGSVIAAFYADVDTTDPDEPDASSGNIFFRQTTDASLLQRANELVRAKFPDDTSFTCQHLLVCTWSRVGYFDARNDKRNTFQLVLAWSENSNANAYAFLLYENGGMQWTKADPKEPGKQDYFAQIGFMSDGGRFSTVISSGTEEVATIDTLTNIEDPGMFAYRISGQEVIDPQEIELPADDAVPSEAKILIQTKPGNSDDDEYYDGPESSIPGLSPPPPLPEDDFEDEDKIQEPLPATPAEEPKLTAVQCSPEPTSCADPCEWQLDTNSCRICDCLTSAEQQEIERTEIGRGGVSEEQFPDAHPPPPVAERITPAPAPEYYPPPPPQQATQWPETRYDVHEVEPPPPPEEPTGAACDAETTQKCHAHARCAQYVQGFCCHCNPGTYGNGRECLQDDEPQRINGVFGGRINGVTIANTDLHTYVVTSDGRAYTALSEIPPSIGRSLMLLNAVGSVMGWLFARVKFPNGYNGFMQTGGMLNRTVTMHVSDSHTVSITQEFSGKDTFNYFKVKVYVTGTLPEVPSGAEPNFGDYVEEYRRAQPGVIKSYSTQRVSVGQRDYQLTIDQTIRYDECVFSQRNIRDAERLRVERTFVVYDDQERIVRYAAANSIEPLDVEDPCRPGAHNCIGQHMTCAVDGRSYKCLCLDGFELIHNHRNRESPGHCVDIDECQRYMHKCDPNAECRNLQGSYVCVCRPGFRGNGYQCSGDQYCGPQRCHENAECLTGPSGQPECVCVAGHFGNGVDCRPLEGHGGHVCTGHSDCSSNGECYYNQDIREYQCRCLSGFSGDGIVCEREAETCDVAHNCHRDASCVYSQTDLGPGYVCRCNPGFRGDGFSCTREQQQQHHLQRPQEVPCNELNNCSPYAQCIFDPNYGLHRCICFAGYQGDGYTCTAIERPAHHCTDTSDCHENGHCVQNDHGTDTVCECLPGYRGDGVSQCDVADQCVPQNPQDCDPRGRCEYSELERAYVCVCQQGLTGNGKICTEQVAPTTPSLERVPQQSSCDVARNCHPYAQCLYDHSLQRYACRCVEGFTGDGFTCNPQEASCRDHASCGENGECVYDQSTGQQRCQCRTGFVKHGSACVAESTCLDNPSMCDPNAHCLPSYDRRYECLCKQGFVGNGRECKLLAESEITGQTLLFAQGMAIMQRGLTAEEMGRQLIIVPMQIAVGLTVDCRSQKVFWTDITGHAIRQADVDGSNITKIIGDGLESAEGVAVDWSSRNIYYTDSGADTLAVASMDGKYRKVIIKDGLVNPRAVALDLRGGKVYYSDWNRQRPIIERANLDGSGREGFVDRDIALPNGLVILYSKQELCWIDAGLQRLECIGLNGANRRIVFAPLNYPFGLTVHKEEKFFWTDWEDKRIHTVSIYGAGYASFPASIGGSGKLYGIAVVPDQCPWGESACASENGGCKYLCLPHGPGGRSCVCPDNITEEQCNAINGS